jgi:hypothetical protein
MRYATLGIGLVLALAIGCSEKTIECQNGVVETDSSTEATGEGFVCRYFNVHSDGTDCRMYLGDWTQEAARLNCSNPLLGMAKPGNLTNTECGQDGLKGTCTVDAGPGLTYVTYYYAGPADVLSSSCANFEGGTWLAAGPILDGMAFAMPEALAALESDTAVEVEPDCQDTDCLEAVIEGGEWFEFRPLVSPKSKGVIFFPGGAVDPRAYAPAARAFAKAGYLTAIAPYYGSTAEKASDIMEANNAKTDWFMGGHSHGGVTTVSFVASQNTELAGIFLWGASGVSMYDISEKPLDVLVVYAENDGLTTTTEVNVGKTYLPDDAVYELINGGNHAQFGYYGDQEGDNAATITRAAQQAAAVGFTIDLFDGTL